MTVSDDPFSFGPFLQTIRRRQRFTQQALAEAVGVHRRTLVRWEQGDYLPESKAMVLELARVLSLDDQETRQLLEASLLAVSPYWSVPLPRNPYFTGREATLEALHAQLGVEQTVALTQSSALHGLGGIGKTQIALEYAYRYALEYSAIFWIGAETEEQIISSLLRVAEALHLPGREDKEQQHVVAAVQRWLSAHSQWLLIWDNVEDLALLERFLPSNRAGAMLITTRRQALGTLARGLDLLPMEQEEGILFLLRRAKVLAPDAENQHLRLFAEQKPTQYAAAAAFVEIVGGLPLALDQAGAYVEETQCGLSAYLDLFQTRRAVLLANRGEGARDHPASVSTTLQLSILATAERHPAVQDLLRVCALLHPDAIPEELFRQGGEQMGAPLATVCRDALEWDHLVGVTCSYSLLARQPEEQTLSMHRLVQAVLLDTMTQAEREQGTRRALTTLNALFPEATYEVWERCQRLLPHVLACVAMLPDLAADQESLAELLRKAADYLCERAQYERAEPLYQRALQSREHASGPQQADLAAVLGGLAMLYAKQGKLQQAERFYQRALQIREQTLGSEHPEVAHLLSGLAQLCFRQGKYEQAEALHQRALRMREQTLGAEHPLVARSLHGLGYLYARQGKHEQAELLYQRALQIRERVLEPAHPDLATSLNGLAILYQEQGKYFQAEALLQRALQIWEQALGPQHPEVAAPLYSLALISFEQGKCEQAEALYQRALQIWEQALGPQHPGVASPLNGLAMLYLSQGKLEQAQSLSERALQIWEQALGLQHPSLGYPLDTLGTVYSRQGKYEQAESLYQRALQILEQAWGSAHPAVATVLNSLANLSLAQGKHTQAELLYQRALHIQEQHLGQRHLDTAQTLHNLALFRQKQGDLVEAISLVKRACAIRSHSLGETHPKTVATRTLYARLLQEQASAEVEAALRPSEAILGPHENERHANGASSSLQEAAPPAPSQGNPLQEFLEACCVLHPLAWCRSADLWQAYERWVEKCQERYPLSRMAFTQQVKAAGCRTARTSSARIWRGITLVRQEAVTGGDRR